ncbi:MAG: phosphatase PAP2 family protein [Clostridia bacterium]|nr:phosphatase PAP2 family protein [Clostridia bacterium]
MTKEGYIKAKEFFNAHKTLKTIAVAWQKGAEILIYLTYPIFLAVLFFQNNSFWYKSMLVCGVGFVAVSIFRHIYNAPRPYQVYDITPIINKNSPGKSMPSRHCFSAAVIATSIMAVNLPLGIALGVLAVSIAVLRVALGVHFIKDVTVGILLGATIGAVQFFI